jgi:hypothetical protein
MSTQDQQSIDLDYFRRRETEERGALAASECSHAREAHFRMAERYADRAWSLEEANGAPYRASGLWDRLSSKLKLRD